MTGMEPGAGLAARDEPDSGPVRSPGPWSAAGQGRGTHRSVADGAAGDGGRRLGSRPILWRWWLLAAALSLGLWAGIVALVT